MYKHFTQVRVTYADTDQMGFVYYGNYAKFFEIGRVEAIRHLGVSYKALEKEGILLPVSELKVKYLKPAKYDDLLRIESSINELPTAHKIFFGHKIYNQDDVLLTKGEVVLYILDKKSMGLSVLPPFLTMRLEPFFEKNN